MSTDSIAREFLDCLCTAFEEVGRPVCSCYGAVGVPVLPIGCECETGKEGRLVFQFEQMYDADPITLEKLSTRVRPCKKGTVAADFTFWLARCYPTIDSHGELDLDSIDDTASNANDDVDTMWKAFNCCKNDVRFVIRRIAVDGDPDGGRYTVLGQITFEVSQWTPEIAS